MASHKLLLRAGFIRPVGETATGLYMYLPLFMRSLRKLENIIDEELARIGPLPRCAVHSASALACLLMSQVARS